MFTRNRSSRVLAIAFCVTVICTILATSAFAQRWDKKTSVTFSAPVEIPGVNAQVLPAGTYVFKLLDSQADRRAISPGEHATTLEPSTVFRVERRVMLSSLHEQPDLSEKFIALLLTRNIDLEEDLCDQLFNHSEKRLARVLLKLARLKQGLGQEAGVPMLSHETLAEMVGTARSRITHFMNKFRKMGQIDYNGELIVRTELLTDLVLHD